MFKILRIIKIMIERIVAHLDKRAFHKIFEINNGFIAIAGV